MFRNLIADGLKFHDPADPAADVSARREAARLAFAVRDNGIGLPADRRSSKCSPGASGDTEGSGIGLATCRRIVEAHGGRIWAEPAPRGGSVFSFTLPVDATQVRMP